MLDIHSEDGAVVVPVKVVPGASRTRLLGEWNGRVRLAVAAPPEKGKANEAVRNFLATLLGVAKRDVTVIAGHGSPQKKIRIDRIEVDTVRAALQFDRS